MLPPKKSLLSGNERVEEAPPNASGGETPKAWVTCFGFPPGQGDIVIDYFQSFLKLSIDDFEPKGEDNANWIHIKLCSQKDVVVALGKNGQIIEVNNQRIMLGVNAFPEGDQYDAKLRASGATSQSASKLIGIQPGGGPVPVSNWFSKVAVWMFDM